MTSKQHQTNKVTRRVDHVSIREVSGMTILFYDHETIYVQSDRLVYILHRWGVSDATFYSRNFKPFRDFLATSKELDIYEVCGRANRCGLIIQGANKMPDISNRKVNILKGRSS